MTKITLVRADDWVGLYIDGICVKQDHELRYEDIIEITTGDKPEVIWADLDWIHELGWLPESLDDVKAELLEE